MHQGNTAISKWMEMVCKWIIVGVDVPGDQTAACIFNNKKKKKMLYVEEIKEYPLALNKLLTDAGGFFDWFLLIMN